MLRRDALPDRKHSDRITVNKPPARLPIDNLHPMVAFGAIEGRLCSASAAASASSDTARALLSGLKLREGPPGLQKAVLHQVVGSGSIGPEPARPTDQAARVRQRDTFEFDLAFRRNQVFTCRWREPRSTRIWQSSQASGGIRFSVTLLRIAANSSRISANSFFRAVLEIHHDIPRSRYRSD